MFKRVGETDVFDYDLFVKWLDLNPSVRTIIKDGLKPHLWSFNEKGYPQWHQEKDYEDTSFESELNGRGKHG